MSIEKQLLCLISFKIDYIKKDHLQLLIFVSKRKFYLSIRRILNLDSIATTDFAFQIHPFLNENQ